MDLELNIEKTEEYVECLAKKSEKRGDEVMRGRGDEVMR